MVVGDTGRQARVWLYDPINRDPRGNKKPLDVSASGTTVVFRMRAVGGTTLKATVSCSKLAGVVNKKGEIETIAPYNVAGAGGIVQVDWSSGSVDTAGEYEGEFLVTLESGKPLTLYNLLRVSIRAAL